MENKINLLKELGMINEALDLLILINFQYN